MIPDYQTLMLPLLRFLSDGKEHSINEAIENLAIQFKLSQEERNELLPSGQAFLFSNRVAWARTYLKKAGLIDSKKRGFVNITEKGKSVLNENLKEIDVKYLERFPEFIEFKSTKKKDNNYSIDFKVDLPSVEELFKETPEEKIEHGYIQIRKSLEQELLIKLKSIRPSFFEKIVVELLVKMGYGGSIQDAGKAIGKSGDEGIDGIIKEDKLGLDVIYIQAKRWEGVVGRPELHKFVGALAGQRARKGVFITTSSFTKEAITYASQMDTKIVLIDGEQLAQYMIDYNLGVSTQNTYEIKRMDSDYFEED